jgi:hypothetical protein
VEVNLVRRTNRQKQPPTQDSGEQPDGPTRNLPATLIYMRFWRLFGAFMVSLHNEQQLRNRPAWPEYAIVIPLQVHNRKD